MHTHTYYFITILILFIATNSGFCQTENLTDISNDSLRSIWNNASLHDTIRFKAINDFCVKNSYNSPQKIIPVAAYHYDLAISKGYEEESANALENKALALCIQGDCDKAILEMERVVAIIKKFDDPVLLAEKYSNLGTLYYYESQFQEAIHYFSLSMAMFEEKGIEAPLGDIINNIGLVYYDINHFEFALEYLYKALKQYKKTGAETKIGNIWLNIGAIYLEQNKTDQGKAYIQKAIKLLEAEDHLYGISDCYFELAKAYQKNNQIDSAFYYVNQSLAINKKLENSDKILSDKYLIALLTLEKDVQIATQLAEEVVALCDEGTDIATRRDVHQLLYQCYKKQGKTEQALNMHEKYLAFYEKLLTEDNQIAVVRSAIQSDYDYKLFQTQLKNEQIQADLKLNHLKKMYAIILLGVLFILGVLYIARSRTKTFQKQQEQLLQEIERLKRSGNASVALYPDKYQLDRAKINAATTRNINETDWIVLNILLDDPVISNKEIAKKAFLTPDGIGSSLRRMYMAFDIKESKYKKISLIMEAIKISNNLV